MPTLAIYRPVLPDDCAVIGDDDALVGLLINGARGLVIDITRDASAVTAPVWRRIVMAAQHLPILVLADLSARSSRQIVEMAQGTTMFSVALQGIDSFGDKLRAFPESLMSDSTPASIIAALAPVVDQRLRPIVIAAAVCAGHRTSVSTLARACALSPRALEWRLRTRGVLTARDLLGWMTAIHTLNRIEALGWTVKRAAITAGCANQGALSNYVRRHVGAAPSTLANGGGGDDLVARLAARMTPAA